VAVCDQQIVDPTANGCVIGEVKDQGVTSNKVEVVVEGQSARAGAGRNCTGSRAAHIANDGPAAAQTLGGCKCETAHGGYIEGCAAADDDTATIWERAGGVQGQFSCV